MIWWRIVWLDERFDVDINFTNGFNSEMITEEFIESLWIERSLLSIIEINLLDSLFFRLFYFLVQF